MWEFIAITSVIVNIIAFMYVRWLLRRFQDLGEDVNDVGLLIREYVEHIESIYELEMFYGDPTLEQLMKHGRELLEVMEDVDYLLNPESPEEMEVVDAPRE